MHKKLRLLLALLAAAFIATPVYAQDAKLVKAGKKKAK